MQISCRFCVSLLVLWLTGHACAEVRMWTNSDGKKIEASMVSATDSEVVLKMKAGGRNYTVPLAMLSEADVAYVKKQQVEKPVPGTPDAGNTGIGFENWDAEWPSLISGDVSLEIEVAEENEAQGRYVYRSPHYEYICDVKLTQNVVRRFAILFEATNQFVRTLPLSMAKAQQEKRHTILLFETFQSYVKAGGPPQSAGVFIGGKDVIMVPLTSLGVIKGAGGYRVDYDRSNKTLPHEITHQLTDQAYFAPGSMGWFTEGLAEYVAVTPYRSGKFMLRGNQSAIEEYVIGYGEKGKGGRNLGKNLRIPNLQAYLMQDYASFTRDANRNYGIGLLLVYYFFHWDGNGDGANAKAFLKALKQGRSGEDALKELIAGRSMDELKKDITDAWRSRGVTIEFQ